MDLRSKRCVKDLLITLLTIKDIHDTCKSCSLNMRAFARDPRTLIFASDRYRTLKTCNKKFDAMKEAAGIDIGL